MTATKSGGDVISGGLFSSINLAVDENENMLYWSAMNSIRSRSLDDNNAEVKVLFDSQYEYIKEIALSTDSQHRWLYWLEQQKNQDNGNVVMLNRLSLDDPDDIETNVCHVEGRINPLRGDGLAIDQVTNTISWVRTTDTQHPRKDALWHASLKEIDAISGAGIRCPVSEMKFPKIVHINDPLPVSGMSYNHVGGASWIWGNYLISTAMENTDGILSGCHKIT